MGDSNNGEAIILLEEGSRTVVEQGVAPFINFIENSTREFFKAQEFVLIYDKIFKMCIQRDPYNWSEQMYNLYKEKILDYLTKKVAPALSEKKATNYELGFLKEWKQRWHNHKLIVKGLSKLFMYLDRFYTSNNDEVLNLPEQGYKLFKEAIFDTFSGYARNCILNCIEKERNGEGQDRQLLNDSILCFVELGQNFNNEGLKLYTDNLQNHIVKAAGAFYKFKSRAWMDQDSCPTYLEKAERMLNEEKGRVDAYLNKQTAAPLGKACYIVLLKEHQNELLRMKTGVFQMLSLNAVEDLSRLYRLFSKFPADLEPIADMVHEHIKKAGLEVVDAAQQQPGKAAVIDVNHQLVRQLIALHAQYNRVVVDCFSKSQVFQKALKKAFEDFINKDNRVSKLLARFVHDVLKKGTKVNVKDQDSTLDNVVFLYGYIQEKDVFEMDYQKFLSTRLLQGLCESEHAEKAMIAKLKTECGFNWSNKLEGMFKDVQLSKELMTDFKASLDTPLDIALEVNVCQTGYWPTSKIVPTVLPEAIKPSTERFTAFYLGRHGGRKLEWHMDQGQAELMVNFSPAVKRTLTLSSYQMMILLVFNNAKVVTYKQIMDITGIPHYDIANHLVSLVHPKVNILCKRPMTQNLDPADKFMLNPKYTSQLMSVVVPLMKAVEDPNEGKQQQQALQLQRRHQIDASIVRIMKTRKTLKHAELCSEVIQQLQARFKPSGQDIKKRIEALIEGAYLERHPEVRGQYNYLA
mmetsp:Transcript_3443/g.6525  ORF Transcript_3443/g.6525 Transcript_3443/m.6525 type:complete len:746 (+) Transcript_3443:40-2277(+)|eukprot:CAMPEP_0175138390 /NCGR_PEP_ID=MMETSP0087-20121206/10325_1 /TAXON_ID=136419 /ORGANISM="Unknown Unknown, Strain D1" /LENGTH=745 /DNA_ID=CAMNT_0016421293 /DNA_START=36 /DNA_END=2273 /DNA_ORIENTATION=-